MVVLVCLGSAAVAFPYRCVLPWVSPVGPDAEAVDFTPRHRTRHKLGSAKQTKVKQAVQEQEKRKTIKLWKALEEEVKEADLKVEEEPWNPLQRFTKKRVK
ncbi:unnamed protein product [Cyprideis torosa]|uniref:Uncharacterized protein n=1 Tax=Cyprideis torosa TaxID=163714 RepID=A0A7R8W352_9CRUS|nr:unnamed protein product [Cyprideis torosa]CAG0882557.1 unnamed protein product [Cyprideis torosa]